jgi:SAM-dependent methyltransferase
MLDFVEFKRQLRSQESYRDEIFHGRFKAIVDAVPAESKVLDVACGSGTLMATLQEKGCHCVGIDLAPGAVRLAMSKGLQVHLGDIDAFDSDENVRSVLFAEYDAVIFSKCLMYLRRKNEILRALRTKAVLINQANPFYWKYLVGMIERSDIGSYLTADQQEVVVNTPWALMRWGESYGYNARRLHGGWLRGRDMVISLSKD